MNKSWSAWCKKVELSNPADSDTTEEAPHGDYVLHRFGCSQENDQPLREGRQPPYPVYHTGSRHNPWMGAMRKLDRRYSRAVDPDSMEFRPDEGSRPRIVLSYGLSWRRARGRLKLNFLIVGLLFLRVYLRAIDIVVLFVDWKCPKTLHFPAQLLHLGTPWAAEFTRPTEGDSDIVHSKRVGEIAVLYQTKISAQLRNTLNHHTMRWL